MTAQHQLRISDEDGVLKHLIIDLQELAWSRRANDIDTLSFVVSDQQEVVRAIRDRWQVEYQRSYPEFGVDWYTEFEGFFREPDQDGIDPGLFKAKCVGKLSLVDSRIVAWPANTLNRSKFPSQNAETTMKMLIEYNLGANATMANGRIVDGVDPRITIEADGERGNVLPPFYCAYDNLLEALNTLAEVGGGDFDLVKTGGATWEFRFYPGQLGTDRSSGGLVFTVDRGNLIDVRYRIHRIHERTVAIVAGQGEGEERDVVVRTGPNYATDNHVEVYIHATDIEKDDLFGLQARGDEKLKGLTAEDEFTFGVRQAKGSIYGKDFFLGDLIPVVNPFTGERLVHKVVGIQGAVLPSGEEDIAVELANA